MHLILIVQNIGLQARILSTRTFTIFVVMAVVTTVTTAPLTKWLYPARYQRKVEMWRRGEINWDETPLRPEGSASISPSTQKLVDTRIRRILVYLRLESLPSMFTFISLLGEETEGTKNSSDTSPGDDVDKPTVIKKRPLEVHALRIHELTDRTSSVMKVTELDEITRRDPVANAFRTFSQLHDVAASGSVVVAPEDAYADTVVSQASNQGSDFVLIPWSEIGSPFETSPQDRFSGRTHLDFIQRSLNEAVCTTGIFISNGFSGIAPIQKPAKDLRRTVSNMSMRSQKEAAYPPIADKSHHVFIPFIGGADDRAALRFVFLLARNPHVTATIAQLHWDGEDDITEVPAPGEVHSSSDPKSAISTEVTAQDASIMATMRRALPADLASRVTFLDQAVQNKSSALTWAASMAKEAVGQNARNAGDIIVVGRRQAKLAAGPSVNDDMVRTVGTLGAKMATSDLKASVLIIQEAGDASGSS